MTNPNSLSEYYKSISDNQIQELNRVKNAALSVVPESIEVLSYGVPTLDYQGKHLLHYAAFKNHFSLFPGPSTITQVQDRLSEYKVAKGTIQYSAEKPIPEELIKTIVAIRKAEIDK